MNTRDPNSGSPKSDTVKLAISVNTNLAAGVTAGMFNAVALHGLDRALFLRSVDKHPKHFFAPAYWSAPFNGLSQTIVQRVFSQGCYFAVRGELNTHLAPTLRETQWSEPTIKVFIGILTGTCTGILANANNTVKAYTFCKSKKRKKPTSTHQNTFWHNAAEMWKQGGVKPFAKGISPSICRDAQFGLVKEGLDYVLDTTLVNPFTQNIPEASSSHKEAAFFASRLFSSTIATASSSTWNYARNQQVATLPVKPQPHTLDIWSNLWRESNKAKAEAAAVSPDKKVSFARARFLQARLQIGLGTARSGVGMALGELVFKKCVSELQKNDVSAVKPGKGK